MIPLHMSYPSVFRFTDFSTCKGTTFEGFMFFSFRMNRNANAVTQNNFVIDDYFLESMPKGDEFVLIDTFPSLITIRPDTD
jgi:hypothetical protein